MVMSDCPHAPGATAIVVAQLIPMGPVITNEVISRRSDPTPRITHALEGHPSCRAFRREGRSFLQLYRSDAMAPRTHAWYAATNVLFD
jgi:hypothetical protein